MAYELAHWSFFNNQLYVPTSAPDMTKYQIWFLASFLLGYIGGATQGLWTYVGSSDGVTGEMSGNPANFKWGTPGTYDGTKIVQTILDPATNVCSWIVLKSPNLLYGAGGNCYMCISAYSTNTTGFSVHTSNTVWTLAGNTAYLPTSTNRTPPASNAANVITNDATNTQMVFHGGLSNAGDFYVMDTNLGSGFCKHGILWGNCYQVQGSDAFPFYLFNFYQNSTSGWGTGPFFVSNAVPTNFGRSYTGVAGRNMGLTAGASLSAYTLTRDILSKNIIRVPFFVFWADSVVSCHARGRLKDVWVTFCPSGANVFPQGSIQADADGAKWAVISAVAVPCNVPLFM